MGPRDAVDVSVMDRSFDGVLHRARGRGWWDLEVLERLTTYPCCRPPADDPRAREVEALLPAAARHPHLPVGTAIGVTARGTASALWLLGPGDRVPEGQDLVARPRDDAERARTLVIRFLDVLDEVPLLDAPQDIVARNLASTDGRPEAWKEGGSLGVALGLAAASTLLRLRVPHDLVATAQVLPNGLLDAVECLDVKLAGIAALAPGVHRVLVARPQEAEARALVRDLPRHLEILPAHDLREAVGHAFPDRVAAVRARLQADGRGPELAQRLFLRVMAGRRLLPSWAAVQAAATELTRLGETAGDPATAWRAGVVHAIAARHDLDDEQPMPWDEAQFGSLPLPLQLSLLAQACQHAADVPGPGWHEARVDADHHAPPAGWEAWRARAEAMLDTYGPFPAGLRLRGALVRLLASYAQVDEAMEHARSAVQGWFDLGEHDRASHPLCEWIRLYGATRHGSAADFEAFVTRWVEPVLHDEHLGPTSSGFLHLALARAWAQLGDGERCRRLLGDGVPTTWSVLPPHVRATRRRWLIASGVLSDDEVAAELRALHALSDNPHDPVERRCGYALALAELDLAAVGRSIGGARPPSEAWAALDVFPYQGELDRLLVVHGATEATDEVRDELVRRWWRY